MNWIKRLFSRRQLSADLSAEIQEHLAEKVEELVAGGMSREEATFAARREFGNVLAIEERSREVWRWPSLEDCSRDVRFGFRQLRKNPAFTAVAVLTLALGIGANTAIFTLIDAVMLPNLPVRDPARLVLFYQGVETGVYSGQSFPSWIFSYQSWEYLRDHNESFESLCAFEQGNDELVLHTEGAPDSGPLEHVRGHLVSGTYFDTLGVRAALGRTLTPADDTPAAPPVAVMSYNFWRRRWNRDSSIIGKAVDLNGALYTVVGVTLPEFFGERVRTAPDFWLPLAKQPQALQRESWLNSQDVYWLNMMGRLRPVVTLAGAQAALEAQLRQFYTAQTGSNLTPERQRSIQNVHLQLTPGGRGISVMRFVYSEPLHVLMAVVALVLLIACANVATLLLARASGRGQEWFMRRALGAGRARLIRQMLTESILLALLGAGAGLALAWWGVRILVVMVGVNSVARIKPDLPVLGFTLAIAVLTGILFGLIPALRTSRVQLKGGGRTHSGGGRAHSRSAQALVILQVTLSLVLLVGAALLTHSLLDLEREDLGFRDQNVLLVSTDPRLAGYKPEQLPALYQQLQDRLNALPGVVSASIARYTPLSGSSSSGGLSIEGYIPPAGKEMNVYGVEVGPRFFETLEIPLLLGRTIGPQDTAASPKIAVVNKTFVDTYLPGQNPIGRHFSLGFPFEAPGLEIIGVVADSRYFDAREKPKPMAFFAAWQGGGYDRYVGVLMARTTGDPSGAAAEVRQAINEIDSRLPIMSVGTLRDQVYGSLEQERMITTLCSFFGVLALLLACVGLYGTMAYSVTQRTNEIGIRMALGAKPVQVLWMVLRESMALIISGLAIGLPLAVFATRSIKSFLFGLPPVDVVGMGAAIVVLTAVATLAGYLPARRATKVDPMVALRYE